MKVAKVIKERLINLDKRFRSFENMSDARTQLYEKLSK